MAANLELSRSFLPSYYSESLYSLIIPSMYRNLKIFGHGFSVLGLILNQEKVS